MCKNGNYSILLFPFVTTCECIHTYVEGKKKGKLWAPFSHKLLSCTILCILWTTHMQNWKQIDDSDFVHPFVKDIKSEATAEWQKLLNFKWKLCRNKSIFFSTRFTRSIPWKPPPLFLLQSIRIQGELIDSRLPHECIPLFSRNFTQYAARAPSSSNCFSH